MGLSRRARRLLREEEERRSALSASAAPAAPADVPTVVRRRARRSQESTTDTAALIESLPWLEDDVIEAAPAPSPTTPVLRSAPGVDRPARPVRPVRPSRPERSDEHIREIQAPVVRPAAATDGEGTDQSRQRSSNLVRAIFEWMGVLVAAGAVALVLQLFVFQLYEIPSESMYPTLQDLDRVAVNKLAYSIGGGVERGDVIVFRRPEEARTDDPNQPAQLIKRVIGLPGDVVEARGGVVYVNGKALPETGPDGYLSTSVITNNLPQPVTVPRAKVFVLGDNREHSHDSRFFGAIPESDIIGRAVAIAWPFDRWRTL